MSIYKATGLLALAVNLLAACAVLAEGPALGVPLTKAEIAALDYVVLPDGDGLPAGEGDAVRGRVLYDRHCLSCHGSNGVDGISDRLAGGHGSIDGERPLKTVGSYWPYATTLFDYLRRAMPYQSPGSLSADEVYSLTAFVLFLNDIIAESDVLNADTLPDVQMPNRDNFVWAFEPR